MTEYQIRKAVYTVTATIIYAVTIAACGLAIGTACRNINVAWRGVVYNTDQKAETDAKIANRPQAGNASVAADKDYKDAFNADTKVGTKPETE